MLRDGQVTSIDARELVPGDIVEVAVGDRVPADMRIIKVLNKHSLDIRSLKIESKERWGGGGLLGRGGMRGREVKREKTFIP